MFARTDTLLSRIRAVGASKRRRTTRTAEVRRLRLEPLEDRRMLATLYVNSLDDGITENDGDLMLREAIDYVNGTEPGSLDRESNGVVHIDLTNDWGVNDTILFDSSLNGETINLLQGGLEIKRSVKIDASDLSQGITIDMSDETSSCAIHHISDFINSVSIELVGLTFSDIVNQGVIFLWGLGEIDHSYIIRDCKIINNQAEEGTGNDYPTGLGITARIDSGDSLLIENTSVCNNIYEIGAGGIGIEASDSANVEIVGCDILDNTTKGGSFSSAGGIDFYFLDYEGNIRIAESVIKHNRSDDIGGGIRFHEDTYGCFSGNLEIEDCMIANNSAGNHGGGIYISLDGGDIEIANSTIKENTAGCIKSDDTQGVGSGGGIFLYDDESAERTVIIDSCLISDNKSDEDGGGIYIDLTEDEIEIINTTISENKCEGSGGGVYTEGKVLIAHSTIVQNEVGVEDLAEDYDRRSRGGGLYTKWNHERDYANAVLYHTIIADNHDNSAYEDTEWGENRDEPRFVHNIFIDGPIVLGDDPSYSSSIVADYCFLDDPRSESDRGLHLYISPINAYIPVDYDENDYYSDYDYDIRAGGILESGSESGYTIVDYWNDYAPNSIVDPELHDHGGPTLTHPLLPGENNPAIDGGDPLAVSGGTALGYLDEIDDEIVTVEHQIPLFDQRGITFDRVCDGDNNGIDIIDMGAYELQPVELRVIDVVIDGTDWACDPYVYSEIVPLGNQLRPIPTDGADTIEIHFNGSADLEESDGTELFLAQTIRSLGGGASNEDLTTSNFSYNDLTKVATWVFLDEESNSELVAGKYAIHLDDVTSDWAPDLASDLDGDWYNADNGTPDDFTDDIDDPKRFEILISGGGVEGSEDNEFRFHFSILPGDYNQDGIVDADDGNNIGDGDGDGIIEGNSDQDDWHIWNDNILKELPLRDSGGDFSSTEYENDEKVDTADLARWTFNFGEVDINPTGTNGDADGDGDVDGSDFLIWQQGYGDYSAWCLNPPGSGSGSGGEIIGPDVPQIVNVIISGSLSQHDPYSFADALLNGQPVIGSGYQLATVPVGGADTITIVFSEAVNITADSLDVIGLTTANVPKLAEFAYDVSTHTASWRFEGWALGDRYLLMVRDAVTDVDGNLLDGEWVNPANMTTVNALVSEFPSGDGDPGGNFHFLFTLLPGDANLDLKVDGSDLAIMAGNWGLGVSDLSALFTQGDFDGDGMVSSGDLALLSMNFNTNLQNTWLLADFDGDFDVDDDDLAVISANAGMTGATWEDGDLNGDGEVTVEDFDLALALFGLDLELVS